MFSPFTGRGDDGKKKDNDVLWDALSKAGIAEIDTYTEEEPFGMTNGRAIAKFLSRFRWYNPSAFRIDDDDATAKDTAEPTETHGLLVSQSKEATPTASLDVAWHYFEHSVLPRRFCSEDGGRIRTAIGCVKAPPGEAGRPTMLYNSLHTTMHELADFGIGIGLYFSMLRGVSMVMLVAALIHIPNFLYFASTDYSSQGQSAVEMLLTGSAICTSNEWVPCPSCERDDAVIESRELWSTSRVVESDDGLLFALKNTCGGDDDYYLYARGLVSWVGTVFIVIALLAMGEVQRKLAVEFDERNATATDFSVRIKNPPKDAVDAIEWKAYLEKVASVYLGKHGTGIGNGAPITPRDTHVTCLTVALNNYQLTDTLIARRRVKRKLMDEVGINEAGFDEIHARAIQSIDTSRLEGGAKRKMAKILELDDHIGKLGQKTYDATSIFVSFETEVGQRAVLTALSVSKIAIWKNKKEALDDESYAFRGRVLDAMEPSEPLTVRWHDLGHPKKEKYLKRFSTLLISLVVVFGAFLLVRHVWLTYGTGVSAIFIAVLNILTPLICRGITGFEIHPSEGEKQASHSLRVLGLRCVNSAVIIHLVTPFAWSLTNGEHLIKAIAAIFVAEMFTAPLVQALFIPGIIKMHIVAPRCKDQETMNQCFTGCRWELGERYTNMMKVLFLCFFFSALFPGAFALSAVLLFIHYEMDKFCLMRVWARVPSLGAQVAERNRSFIVPFLLVLLACMNAYNWSAFPYDDLCLSSDAATGKYVGRHTLTLPEDGPVTVAVKAGDDTYYACDQDFLNFPIQFPAFPIFQGDDHWMSEGQEAITKLHAWTSLVVIGIAIFYIFFLSEFAENMKAVVKGTYEPSGVIYGTDFSDIPGEIFEAYVPQVPAAGFSFPLIACDITGIESKFIGWTDDDGDPSEHVLFDDLPSDVTGNKDKPVFSIMKHWKPPPAYYM